MRILLLRPARIKQAISIGEFMYCEPIGLEMVAAVLKQDHQVHILDLMSDPDGLPAELGRFRPDAVGITSLCIDVRPVLALAALIRQRLPQTVIVVGGTQAGLMPEAFFDDTVDYVFRFTTRANLLGVFSALAAGQAAEDAGVLARHRQWYDNQSHGQNEYILPDRQSTLQWRKHYSYFGLKPCAIMQTSRGCSGHCDFCLRWRMEGPSENPLPMDTVFADLRSIPEAAVMIFDNDFLNDAERLDEFCDRLQSESIAKRFICYASVRSVLRNQTAIRRFAENGLVAVLIGYESTDSEELQAYGKGVNYTDNLAASRWLREQNIDVWASFILHPDWDAAAFRALRSGIRQLAPQVATFSPLTPFPGLPLYGRYKNRLLHPVSEYEAWSFGQVLIRPSKLSLREYYRQMLWTVLYVNLRNNSAWYLVRRFGPGTLIRMAAGMFRLFRKFHVLMHNAPDA